MKNAFLLSLFLVVLICCNTNNSQKQVKTEPSNQENNKPQITYIICYVRIYMPHNLSDAKGFDEYYATNHFSDIIEISDYNTDKGVKELDMFEKSMKNKVCKIPDWPLKIEKRWCFTYSSYTEASNAWHSMTEKYN